MKDIRSPLPSKNVLWRVGQWALALGVTFLIQPALSRPKLPELPDPPELCADFVCRGIVSCDGTAACSNGLCTCWEGCNNANDCTGNEICHQGVCIARSGENCSSASDCSGVHDACDGGRCVVRCNRREECSSDLVCSGGNCSECQRDGECGTGMVCQNRHCVMATPQQPPPPECQTAADCSNTFACDGTESCVNGSCRRGTSPCIPGQADRVACSEDATRREGYRCEAIYLTEQRDEWAMVDLGPSTGDLQPPSRPRPYVVKGAVSISGKLPDLTKATVAVALANQKGALLVKRTLAPTRTASWSGNKDTGFLFADSAPGSSVQKFTLTPDKKAGIYLFQAAGTLASDANVPSGTGPVFVVNIDATEAPQTTVLTSKLGSCAQTDGKVLRCTAGTPPK